MNWSGAARRGWIELAKLSDIAETIGTAFSERMGDAKRSSPLTVCDILRREAQPDGTYGRVRNFPTTLISSCLCTPSICGIGALIS